MEIQKIDLETMYKCVPMRQLGMAEGTKWFS